MALQTLKSEVIVAKMEDARQAMHYSHPKSKVYSEAKALLADCHAEMLRRHLASRPANEESGS